MTDPPPLRTRRGRPPKAGAGRTRELLLDAALQLFAERGFAATTVRQIGRAAGVTDAAIYFHFANKAAIFDALMAQGGPPLLLRIAGDLGDLALRDPAEVIPELFGQLVLAWSEHRVRLFTSMMLRHAPERIASAVTEARTQLLPAMTAWQAQGRLRGDTPAELLAWELLAPLAALRLTQLHAEASEADLAVAFDQARQHLAFFVRVHGRSP